MFFTYNGPLQLTDLKVISGLEALGICLNKRTILPTGTSFQGYINSNGREISTGKKQTNSFSNSALGSRFDR